MKRFDSIAGLVCVCIGLISSIIVALGDLRSHDTMLLGCVAVISTIVLLADAAVWWKGLRTVDEHVTILQRKN
ncbi:MAG: hypothetical protein IKS59_07115 [Aeriscardovia sp.]|nr:hypothetical protein [Aeriscardovia sp.]